MMATNNDWAVPIGTSGRRYFVINVKSHQRNKTAYFNPIQKQMDNGGLAGFMHFLKTRDLSKFDAYNPPKTNATMQQKVYSLHPTPQFIHDKLQNGYWVDGLDFTAGIPVEVMVSLFIRNAGRAGARFKGSEDSFGREMRKIFEGDGLLSKKRHKLDSFWENSKLLDNPNSKKDKIYHYHFSSLQACRDAFDKYIGGKLEWNPIDDADAVPAKSVENDGENSLEEI